jgi:hypothetical protein
LSDHQRSLDRCIPLEIEYGPGESIAGRSERRLAAHIGATVLCFLPGARGDQFGDQSRAAKWLAGTMRNWFHFTARLTPAAQDRAPRPSSLNRRPRGNHRRLPISRRRR